MSVRAKFKVRSVTISNFGQSIELEPVTHGSPENERFYKETPGGKIVLSTINKNAGLQFKPDDEFYVDFTKAEG